MLQYTKRIQVYTYFILALIRPVKLSGAKNQLRAYFINMLCRLDSSSHLKCQNVTCKRQEKVTATALNRAYHFLSF